MSEPTDEIRESTKDFLAHLRLVHFGLAATSLALMVAATIAPPYVLENAYRQAGEIRRIESINARAWVGDNTSLTGQVRRLYDASPFGVSDGQITLTLAIDQLYVNPESLAELLPDTRFISLARYGEPDVPFTTLGSFRDLWNDLARMSDMPAIVGWSPIHADLKKPAAAEWQPGALKVVPNPEGPSESHLHVERTEFVQSEDGNTSLVVWFESSWHDPEPLAQAIRIPLTIQQQDYQDLLSTELGVTWRPGEFADSFKDLERFANGLGSLEFRELEDHLGRLASEVGPPIQLFGAAIPVKSLRIWGPIILLAIQAYFLLHTRRYERTVRDPGESRFPWLGIYDDSFSKALFSGSVSVLPVAAVFTVGVLSEDIRLLPINPMAVLLLMAGISSFVLAFATLLEVNEGVRKLYASLVGRQLTRRCS